MELVNMASTEPSSELMVIEYVPLEETIIDKNIYTVHPYENGNKSQLFYELENEQILDITAEQFCTGKNLRSEMNHIQRYSYKHFTQCPDRYDPLNEGLKVLRADNCVYIDDLSCVYWRVEVMYQSKFGYIKISDQTLSPQHRFCLISMLFKIWNFIISYVMIW
eukprot:341833_1